MKSRRTTNKFTPLENSLDEQTMNWHNDALRPAHDAKEMSPHLQPTANQQNGLVVKHMQTTRIVFQKLKNMQRITNFTYLVQPYI